MLIKVINNIINNYIPVYHCIDVNNIAISGNKIDIIKDIYPYIIYIFPGKQLTKNTIGCFLN